LTKAVEQWSRGDFSSWRSERICQIGWRSRGDV
jgi:hypothetical protein